MAENMAALNQIRIQVAEYQKSLKSKLTFPALYAELVIFTIYLILSNKNKYSFEIELTSFIFVILLGVVITLAYIQMKRLNTKLAQVRYLIFSSHSIFDHEDWNDQERASAVEYARDSSAFVQINCLAYVFAMLNLLILSVLITGFM